MKYVYIGILLLFMGLGLTYLYYSDEACLIESCALCRMTDRQTGRIVNIVSPKTPFSEGHFIVYTHRHLETLDQYSGQEKEGFLKVLAGLDRFYLEQYGLVGHMYYPNLSSTKHLYLDVVPKRGFYGNISFQFQRFVRLFSVNGNHYLLDLKPVDGHLSKLFKDLDLAE